MQIVIDMPEENYEVLLTKIMLTCRGCKITELVKEHGRLVDVEDVKNNIRTWRGYLDEHQMASINFTMDNNIPTILEADKESD